MDEFTPFTEEPIRLSLSKDEAIVLFDFLTRFSNLDTFEIHDQAENRVLWNLQCDLEAVLEAPFQTGYAEILAKARAKVRDE